MRAEQLIVKPMHELDTAVEKINELIDSHNALVRHCFATGDMTVLGSAVDGKPSTRNYIGQVQGVSSNEPNWVRNRFIDGVAPSMKTLRQQAAEQVRACHALLIAWGHTCNHVENQVDEIISGVIKCRLCGLPYIPVGDGDI